MSKPYQQELDEATCIRCKRTQPVANFHKDSRLNSGHRAACKDCVRKNTSKWYDENKADKNAKNEVYRKSHWEQIKQKTYARIDPKKHQARQAVNNAVKAGKFEKESCRECDSPKTDFHHPNGYDKDNWFVGVWLCRPCHAKLHKELRWKKI